MTNQSLIPIDAQARELPTSLPFDVEILAGQLRDSSRAMYSRDIATYLAFAEAETCNPLDSATLVRWRVHLSLHTKKSPHTLNRMLSAVKRLMAEAAEQKLLSHEVADSFADRKGVKVRALKDRLKPNARTYIAPAEMRRLAEQPDTATLCGKRDWALLHTLAGSGIRLSEAASLTLGQIRPVEGGHILEVCGKTDEEPRAAPLSEEAFQAIQEWLATRPVASPYIFTAADGKSRWTARPLLGRTIEKIVAHYAKAIDLEHVKPHDFRRFVGTQLARKDIHLAQKALGHKSILTTERHYVLDKLEVGLTDHLY